MGTVTTKTTGRALRRFVRGTQASDWDALDQALRDAINGVWSMTASNLAARIVAAARLVGPTPPKSVPWRLVSGGVYDAVLDAGKVPHASLTPEFVAETDARMAEYGPVGPAAVRHFARTVEEIRSPAESAWISRGGK